MRWPWQRNDVDGEVDLARTPATERDERLSEYLDGALPTPARRSLETEVEGDADLRAALNGMRAVRAGVAELGLVRAPRAFTVAPSVAPRPVGVPRLELFMRLGAAAAALALTVVSVVPSFTGGTSEEAALRTTADGAVSSSQEAATSNAAKQAPEAVAPQAGARSAQPAQAPAAEGGASAGGATSQAAPAAAPALAPANAPPAAAPAAPQGFGAPAGPAPTTSDQRNVTQPAAVATPERAPAPVELRRGRDGVLQWAQYALAGAAIGLTAAAVVLQVRRRASP